MKYAVIVEEGETSFGAHVPDLPGCVAVAKTKEEVLELIQEAIESAKTEPVIKNITAIKAIQIKELLYTASFLSSCLLRYLK